MTTLQFCQKTINNAAEPKTYNLLTEYISDECITCEPTFRKSHTVGLAETGFSIEDMPFERGLISEDSFPERNPLEILWEHTDEVSKCEMVLKTTGDGVFQSVKGSCFVL